MFSLPLIILYIFVFLVGSVVGSFLNVVIYRLPLGISVAQGRSFCEGCKRQLKFYELIPIFSRIALKGKCPTCGERISLRYSLVEGVSGLFACLCFYTFGPSVSGIISFGVISILLAISMVDWDTMTIPDPLNMGLAILALLSALLTHDISMLSRVVGAFIISAPMLIISLIVAGAFGGGDIKLMFAAGFLLGWENAVVAFFIGILTGGIYAIYLLATNYREKMGRHFPFGPFLAVGIALSMFYGPKIIEGYLELL